MYGAVLAQKTEIEDAAIGTFFLTNDGCATQLVHLTRRINFDVCADTVPCAVMPP